MDALVGGGRADSRAPAASWSSCNRSYHDDADEGEDAYGKAIENTWRRAEGVAAEGVPLMRELVRYATLVPSSHNTQCWRFRIGEKSISILPYFERRCPVVDPDDHHLFVSLGCATENLIQAAPAHGLKGEASFDAARDAIRLGDGPYATSSGNPDVPDWLKEMMFGLFFTPKAEKRRQGFAQLGGRDPKLPPSLRQPVSAVTV